MGSHEYGGVHLLLAWVCGDSESAVTFYGLRAIQISQLYIAIDDDVFRCTLYMGEKGAEICAGVTDFLFSYDAYGYVFIIAVQLDFLYSNGVVSFNMLPTYMVYRKRIPYIFVIAGMLTSFLDLLTYPLYTWAFPLLLLILLSEDGQKALNYVKTVVVSGLGWILGYAGMWFGKWALAGWIVHRNVIQEAWKEVLFRSGSEESLNLIARLEALYDNWKHYEYPLYTALLAIWLTWFIYKSLNGKTQIVRQEKNGAYLLITLSSFVWYFVLANHTLGHHFFTYRIWGVAITGILFLFCGSIVICKDNCSGRDRIYTFCKWGILCILAVMLTLTAREDVSVLNGNVEYQEIELSKGEQIEEEFLPSFHV